MNITTSPNMKSNEVGFIKTLKNFNSILSGHIYKNIDTPEIGAIYIRPLLRRYHSLWNHYYFLLVPLSVRSIDVTNVPGSAPPRPVRSCTVAPGSMP